MTRDARSGPKAPKAPRATKATKAAPRALARGRVRGIAAGYLAMVPLLVAYELSLVGPDRSVAELIVTLPLAPLGSAARGVRLAILGLLAVWAAWRVYRETREDEHPGLVPIVGRIVVEGAIAALLIGPILLALLWVLDADLDSIRAGLSNSAAATPLERAEYLAGAAAWEEILFRIGLQSLLWVVSAELLRFLTASRALVVSLAEILSILGAGALFAASHLAVFTQVLGPGGEPFDPAVFTARLLAGILFGALFRWRGPGVAAWAHALFDLALSIGAGPEVFL